MIAINPFCLFLVVAWDVCDHMLSKIAAHSAFDEVSGI